jgi:hypothetical protein
MKRRFDASTMIPGTELDKPSVNREAYFDMVCSKGSGIIYDDSKASFTHLFMIKIERIVPIDECPKRHDAGNWCIWQN